jgi:hypothetical protein
VSGGDYLNGPCLKLALSKILGYAVISGAFVVKVPQIIKILRAKSALGLVAGSGVCARAGVVVSPSLTHIHTHTHTHTRTHTHTQTPRARARANSSRRASVHGVCLLHRRCGLQHCHGACKLQCTHRRVACSRTAHVQGFPWSTFGENVVLLLQNVVIVGLIWCVAAAVGQFLTTVLRHVHVTTVLPNFYRA